jgi:alpha-L-fucosidase
MLVDIASKGGNLLLNVGPTAEGLIPDSSVVRLRQIGEWMKLNGESVYGTSASPFFKLNWGRCTQKQEGKNTLLYLHVFNWPKDEILRVPGMKSKISDVYLLSNPNQKFAWKFEDGDALIHAPSVIFDPINTVVVVKVKGTPEITSNMPSLKEGKIILPADFADIHNPGYGTHAVLNGTGENAVIKNWVDARVRLEWMFTVAEPGTYKIQGLINSPDSCIISFAAGEQKINALIQPTNGNFETIQLGEIQITKAGNQLISVTPEKEKWSGIELKNILLVK